MDAPPARRFVSVKFTPVGRVQTFLLPDLALDGPLAPGDPVVVDTPQGSGYGTVARTPTVLAERKAPPPGERPGARVRRATREDILARLRQREREREAHRFATLRIRERGLPMKLTRVEHAFDGSRLVFYFTAEGRVDFRELVRELAARFHMRIEMRQIGVRDEAQLLGGYGSCGRPLCCTTWLQRFEPISIRMAKQQHLSLNPSRLSGLCGRLKCCLRYELPNANGEPFAGCAHESACSNPTGGCGAGCGGGCGAGGPGSGHCGTGGVG
jgi:cell fate regulator YaaT (PSP1 superfamily)